MRSFFITGTDTGIGKTTLTCAISNAARSLGMDIGVMKPFATGIAQKNGPKSTDVELLVKYSGVTDSESLINPYFFPIPTSPYRAAKQLGQKIEIESVLNCFEKLQTMHDCVLVEGIGGILTPILKDYFVADLIKDLNLGTVIVAGNKMGSANHTMMTLNMCKKYGIRVLGLVINQTDPDGYDLTDLEDDLVLLSGVEILCKIPHIQSGDIKLVTEILQQNSVISRL